jgi:hypothetical protein
MVCSSSLIYLLDLSEDMEEAGYGREDLSTANFLLESHQIQKEISGDKSTGLFPELTLQELVFLCRQYNSIFLLQQEASAL